MRLNHLFFCPIRTLSDRQLMSWFLIIYKEAGETTGAQSSLGNSKIIHILYVSVYYILEKAVAPYSSTFAWQILWMEEPGGCSSWGR